jgi:hypothetical protein
VPAEASAHTGAFLNILRKITFSTKIPLIKDWASNYWPQPSFKGKTLTRSATKILEKVRNDLPFQRQRFLPAIIKARIQITIKDFKHK